MIQWVVKNSNKLGPNNKLQDLIIINSYTIYAQTSSGLKISISIRPNLLIFVLFSIIMMNIRVISFTQLVVCSKDFLQFSSESWVILRTVEEAVLDSSGFFYGRKILVCYGDVLYVHFDGEGCRVFLSSLLRELVFVEYRIVFWALNCHVSRSLQRHFPVPQLECFIILVQMVVLFSFSKDVLF